MKFAFGSSTLREEAVLQIDASIRAARTALSSPQKSSPRKLPPDSHLSTRKRVTNIIAPLSRTLAAAISTDIPNYIHSQLPKVINLPREVLRPMPPLHFVCLTIGSRGDVQPYIALGIGLQKEGHRVTIVTHEEYKEWIEGFGIVHRQAGGDPGALMKLSVENKVRVTYYPP